MLSLVNRGKAEPKSTASATNDFFMQAKVRIGESLLLIICKILSKGWTIWFRGWLWDTYLWSFIIGLLRKLRRFHPILHQGFKQIMADIYLSPKHMQSGRWSVDIVLRTNIIRVIFRHTTFAEKQGGMCWRSKMAWSQRVTWVYNGMRLKLWVYVTIWWPSSRWPK